VGNFRTYLIPAVIVVVLLVGGAYWMFSGSSDKDGEGRDRQAVLVTLAPAGQREFVDEIEAVGTAKANESIDLTAKSAETIGKINFVDGQKVDAGFVVAELTLREQSADLTAAKAELNEATKAHKRILELSAKGFATRAQLDQTVAARDTAAAKVNALQSRVTDRLIRAPFAGVLGLRRVSVGTLVKPGDVVTTLDDITVIKLDFTVPEAFLGGLKDGMAVRAKVAAYPDKMFEGKVVGIDTRIDPVSRAVALRAEIANPDGLLKPGMLMTVALINNQRLALAVPEQSLVPLENKQYVYVVKEDKAERREVKIGARQPGFVEILSGLTRGEKVVVDGTLRLRPGATVRVQGDEPRGERGKKGGGGAEGKPEAMIGPRT
jgi:membrane fusion protein (multidrug efflux system)